MIRNPKSLSRNYTIYYTSQLTKKDSILFWCYVIYYFSATYPVITKLRVGKWKQKTQIYLH